MLRALPRAAAVSPATAANVPERQIQFLPALTQAAHPAILA
jgi:hypothetical protein